MPPLRSSRRDPEASAATAFRLGYCIEAPAREKQEDGASSLHQNLNTESLGFKCMSTPPKKQKKNWVLSFKWSSVYFHFLSLLNETKPKLRGQGAGRGRVPGGRGLVADLRTVQRQQRDLLQPLGPLPAPQTAPPPHRQLLQQPPQARGAPAAALLGRRPGPHVPGLLPARTAGRAPREEPPPAPPARAGAAVAGRAPSLRLGLGERRAAPLQARHPLQQPVPRAAALGAAGPRVRHARPGPLLRTSAPGGGRGPRLGNPRAGRLGGGLKTRKGRSSPFCRLPECAPRPSPVGVAKETRTLTPQCPAEASAPGTECKPPAPATIFKISNHLGRSLSVPITLEYTLTASLSMGASLYSGCLCFLPPEPKSERKATESRTQIASEKLSHPETGTGTEVLVSGQTTWSLPKPHMTQAERITFHSSSFGTEWLEIIHLRSQDSGK
ncbi:hypothetical protein J1605_015646 [Eschrichtius robustus]|uniref:Uncharacterized protein n=1 Tax=Eschrichtius robustus TaxID=9764 RepID=A0AB34GAY4_ESCRO|nr:hypothetical protein J1605_015646 [Eschrichtius robustus]